MEQYIPKTAVITWIENLLDKGRYHEAFDCAYRDGNNGALYALKNKLNLLEVKEVDLEKELESWRHNHFHGRRDKEASGEYLERSSQLDMAKHFFELGLNASNPITEENLESLVREVIDLYLEAGKHYDSVIKEERKKYGGSDLAIKLLDGVIDAEELGIQYVLDKLKGQKGE